MHKTVNDPGYRQYIVYRAVGKFARDCSHVTDRRLHPHEKQVQFIAAVCSDLLKCLFALYLQHSDTHIFAGLHERQPHFYPEEGFRGSSVNVPLELAKLR